MRTRQALAVGGVTPFTSLDFPGRLAAVVHLQFCPLACPYCHAPHLQPKRPGTLAWPEVLAWLGRRRGLLDGVVFSGGEPTAQPGLVAALSATRALGFLTGLHTSGLYPRRLAEALPVLDWIGLDWKAPPSNTRRAVGRAGLGPRFAAALAMVRASGIRHEIRTTYHPAVFSPEDLREMARVLAAHGVRAWIIQEFSPRGVADASLREAPLKPELLAELRRILPGVMVRRRDSRLDVSAIS
ncbi:MAG: anaerobic ribonucleoside-triphosphate reductase activating protein [Acidobacteriia bacterium]|nr:anaerobic ribonucleoside-triphosphate reductase activating protein [Methyloceanibacter sp.]MCL6492411.1 anaerobic ribonucleoside-triphosphate reductase activating protein [Terriglobia bacterium]